MDTQGYLWDCLSPLDCRVVSKHSITLGKIGVVALVLAQRSSQSGPSLLFSLLLLQRMAGSLF